MEELGEEVLKEFYEESEEIIDKISEILEGEIEKEEIMELFRLFHTLKGMCASVGLERAKEELHKCEDILNKAKEKGSLREEEAEYLEKVISEVEKQILELKEEKAEKKRKREPPYFLRVKISKNEQLPGARVFTLLEELKKGGIEFELVSPSLKELEEGNFEGREFLLSFYSQSDLKRAKEIISSDPMVEGVETGKEKGEAFEIETVRVDTKVLDRLMNLVAELIVAKSYLVKKIEKSGNREILEAMHSCDRLLKDLEEEIVSMRMIPLGQVFRKFPRIAKDLASKEGKKVKVHLEGMEVKLDKASLQAISDPMIHIIRNAIDHGIESPEERKKNGKPECGNIWIRGRREGSLVVIEVEDDGRGIDVEKIRDKAIEMGILDPKTAYSLADRDIINLIFLPGFSTSDKISDVSGRGFGMDIVKAALESIGGSIEVISSSGKGTKVVMRMPPTMMLVRGLLVEDGGIPFLIPESLVKELSKPKYEKEIEVKGRKFISRGEMLIPVLSLKKLFRIGEEKGDYYVITVCGERCGAWRVDSVIGFHEVVLKPLPKLIKGLPGISGATILGDGRVALILDLCSLVSYARVRGELS